MHMRKLIASATASAVLLGGSAALIVPAAAQEAEPATAEATEAGSSKDNPRVRAVVRYAVRTSAATIGIPAPELAEALRSGQTVAQVAEAHGVEVSTVVDAVIAPGIDRINTAVTNGRITPEKGARLAELLTQGTNLAANGDYATVINFIREHRR